MNSVKKKKHYCSSDSGSLIASPSKKSALKGGR